MTKSKETQDQSLKKEKSYKIYVPDLTRLDRLEIEKHLPADVVKFQIDPHDQDLHGELAMATAVVIVSLAALRVLAVHLARKRKRQTFRKIVEVESPDGQKKKVTLEVVSSSSESPDAQVLKQLASSCEVDLSSLIVL